VDRDVIEIVDVDQSRNIGDDVVERESGVISVLEVGMRRAE
jgi:hypothetical protein